MFDILPHWIFVLNYNCCWLKLTRNCEVGTNINENDGKYTSFCLPITCDGLMFIAIVSR